MPKLNVNNQNISIFLVIVVVFFAALHGLFSYTVDSEIWSITSSQRFFLTGHHTGSVYGKPLFYALLSLIYWAKLDSIGHIYAAKLIFVGNFIFLNYLFFRLAKSYSKDSKVAALSLLFLLANPTWLAEGFRIRADFLALTTSMLAVLLWLKRDNKLSILATIGILGISVLFTPKSYIWNLPLLIFFIAKKWAEWSGKRKLYFLGASLGGIAFTYVMFNSVLQIRIGLRSAVEYFLQSSVFTNFSKLKFLVDFLFVFNSFYAAPVIWLCILLILGLTMLLNFKIRNSKLAIGLYLVFISLFVSFTPKTYFLWSAVTFIIMVPTVFLITLFKKRITPGINIVVSILLALSSFYYLSRIYKDHSGESQIIFIKNLESFIGDENYKIFDSMGVLPRHGTVFSYVGADDSKSSAFALSALADEMPEIIILTDRIRSYLPEIETAILEPFYVESSSGVYLRKDIVHKKKFVSEIDPSSLFNQRKLRHYKY